MSNNQEGDQKSPPQKASEIVTNYIEENLAAAHAKFATESAADPLSLESHGIQYLVAYFDIHAHHNRLLIQNYEMAREWYQPFLDKVMQEVMNLADHMTAKWTGPFLNRDAFLATLRGHLIGRISHWKAEGLKRARELSTHPQEPAPSATESNFGQPVVGADNGKISQDEALRRKSLLAEYKTATHHPSNRQIYGAKNSGIHKPEFYEWLSGKLSSESATAINFETFLRLKKAPIPRKPHE